MRYFRDYPWGLQLLLFGLMFFTLLMGLGGVIPVIFTKSTGYSFEQLAGLGPASLPALVHLAILMQGIMSIFTFLVPAMLFAYLSTPRPLQYLGLRAPGKSIQIVLVIFIMLGATPVLQLLEGLISKINFGATIKAEQDASDNMMNAFLNMTSFAGFIKVFVVMAIIPALGEEMFFRGMIMRFVKQRSRNMVLPVLFTATLFASVHGNIYGLLSIFVAGVLLSVIYYITGSLWCSIVAHLSFNGTQVILAYLANYNNPVKNYLGQNSIPIYLVIIGAAVFIASFYLLLKNKTPLPADWSDNFTQQELAERADNL
jgi:hypothetical protein